MGSLPPCRQVRVTDNGNLDKSGEADGVEVVTTYVYFWIQSATSGSGTSDKTRLRSNQFRPSIQPGVVAHTSCAPTSSV